MPSLFIILLVYAAYLALGLPDGMLGVAWPSMRAYFHMPIDALGLLPLAGTPGYLIAGFLSGRLVRKFKIPVMVAAGFAVSGLVLLFYTVSPSWYLIAAAGLLSGFGIGAIDAGINLFVTQNLGKKQMQWLHASWGIGITAGPFIMTAAITGLHSWKPGYIVAGSFQLLLAACFAASISVWGSKTPAKNYPGNAAVTAISSTLSQFRVWRSMGVFFLYTGLEAVLNYWAYTLLTESRGVAPQVAGILTGSYWALFTVSRFSAGFYTKFIKPQLLVLICAVPGLLGIILLRINVSPVLSLAGIILTGFCIAPVFPSLMSDTKARVGAANVGNTVGMQMSAAMLGGAVMPGIAGILARHSSPEAIPVFLIILFVAMILLYGTFIKTKLTIFN